MNRIIVKKLINSESASSAQKAELLQKTLLNAIKAHETVQVDFSGLRAITTVFLNTAIGDLYAQYDPDLLNQYILLDGQTLSPFQLRKLVKIVKNARCHLSKAEIDEEL